MSKITSFNIHYKRHKGGPECRKQLSNLSDIRTVLQDEENILSLTIQINLSQKPVLFRNHDYTWVTTNRLLISNPVSPKIIKFSDDECIMPNKFIGTWVYDPRAPLQLEWYLFGSCTTPLFFYDNSRLRNWIEPPIDINLIPEISIFHTRRPFEVSRSKIPFSPVIVFTDHCDFDSDHLLKKQREFFKKNQILVTKGFFLKHYSHKGTWNSSYEKNANEYNSWVLDGHELAFHSITQSIFKDKVYESRILKSFSSPIDGQGGVWIDHGYQPYNFSMQKDEESRLKFIELLKEKKVKTLWNYYDTMEGICSLNQNNYNLLSNINILRSNTSIPDKFRIRLFYGNNEVLIAKYRNLSSLIKSGKWINVIKLIRGLFKPLSKDDKVRKVQILFGYPGVKINFFQTIVVKDWVLALGDPLDKLLNENGVCILHTYFAFLGSHHKFPLFLNEEGEIHKKVHESFVRLAHLIRNQKIWNPTLTQFVSHIDEYFSLDYAHFFNETDTASNIDHNIRYIQA